MDLKDVIAGRTQAETQNLASPTRIGTNGPRSAGFYKSIGLDVLSVGSAVLFGYAYYRYMVQGLSVWFLISALLFFAVLTVLQLFLAHGANRHVAIMLLETVGLVGFFWREDWHILAATAAAVFILFIWGYFSGRSMLTNSIEIPFFGVTKNVLGKFTSALLVFMILTYVPNLSTSNTFVSRQSFRTFFDWSSGIVSNFYPGLSLNGTFGDFAQSFAKMELASNDNFQTLNTQAQGTAVNQAAAQVETSFEKNSPTPIASTDPASDAFYNLIVGMLAAWKNQSSGAFLIGWAVVLFFVLRSVGIIFVWLAQFVSLIFYEILLATGFMKIVEETQTKEVLGY